MRTVFVDTSAFVALRNSAEREHERARAALRELITDGGALYTSNYVFAETYTALLVRVGRAEAIEWGRRFRVGSAIELVRAEHGVEEAAWEILENHGDKRWSYVDATSFALIERDGGGEAFAFDAHFAQRGLRVLPAPEPGLDGRAHG
jgi:predicted nucleic acid-binding protein